MHDVATVANVVEISKENYFQRGAYFEFNPSKKYHNNQEMVVRQAHVSRVIGSSKLEFVYCAAV
jgi:hypothetical protein